MLYATTTVFTSNSQNVTKYVGKLCRKFCHQELQKWPNQVTLHRTTQFYLESPFNQISAASTTLKNAKSSRRFGIISKAEPKIAPKSSVNKFGKILPLRQNFKSLWAILVCFIQYLANICTKFGKFLCFQENFLCCKWPKIE